MILHGRRQAVGRLALKPDSRVLEVGCGTGLNFRHILDQLAPQRGSLVGLDFSSDMLRRAAQRCGRLGWTNVSLVEADATRLSYRGEFDAILFAYSLTMIPDWRAALHCAVDALRPGGRLVVLDFSRFHAWGPLAPVMRAWLRANHVETLTRYEDEFQTLLRDATVRYWLGGYNFTAVGRKE